MSQELQRQEAVFWIEVERIKPNPFQPRREFDQDKLNVLADSIRQYGVLQPIVVTRKEITTADGGLASEYELIAGERRWRASQLAGLGQIPALIRVGEESDQLKLEMAIIENLQREDLNAVDRAKAFEQLASQFGFSHTEIGRRVGRSREYVSNTIRILAMPEEMLQALVAGKISEGHTRPILMLSDRPEQQKTLFQDIMLRRLTVRDTEAAARRVANDKVRKKEYLIDPATAELERQLTEKLGTRVVVERKTVGGQVTIDFFSNDDLQTILNILQGQVAAAALAPDPKAALEPIPDEPALEEDLYNINNFSI
jgi:ParB family chromosome partitioning protein